MTAKTDGGPAFPSKFEIKGPAYDPVKGKNVEPGATEVYVQLGMALRDAMALSVPMPDEFATSWAAALVGSPQPSLGATALEHIDWWARAEAAYRYRVADAMLKARENT